MHWRADWCIGVLTGGLSVVGWTQCGGVDRFCSVAISTASQAMSSFPSKCCCMVVVVRVVVVLVVLIECCCTVVLAVRVVVAHGGGNKSAAE